MTGPTDLDALAEARLDGELDDAAWASLVAGHGDALAAALTRAAAVRGAVAALDRPELPGDVRAAALGRSVTTAAPPPSSASTGPATSMSSPTAGAAVRPLPHPPLRFPWRAIISASLAAALIVALLATLAVPSRPTRQPIAQRAASPRAAEHASPADRPAEPAKQALREPDAGDPAPAVAARRKDEARLQADADVQQRAKPTSAAAQPIGSADEGARDDVAKRSLPAPANAGLAADVAGGARSGGSGGSGAAKADAASSLARVEPVGAGAARQPQEEAAMALAAGSTETDPSRSTDAPVDRGPRSASDDVDESLLAQARQYVAAARPDIAADGLKKSAPTTPTAGAAPTTIVTRSPAVPGAHVWDAPSAVGAGTAAPAAVAGEVPGPLALSLSIEAPSAVATAEKTADRGGAGAAPKRFGVRIANRTIGAIPLPAEPPTLHGYDASANERWSAALHPIATDVAAGGEIRWEESASGPLLPTPGVVTLRLQWGEARSAPVEWHP